MLIAGAHGTGNIGDEAILTGILKNIGGQTHEHTNILVFSRDPTDTVFFHNVRAVRRNLPDLLTADEVIIGGGELFQDMGFMAFKYSILGLFCKFVGKKVSFYAVGVSCVKSKIARLLMRLSFTVSNAVTVRDYNSAVRLRRMGVNKPICVVNDPAAEVYPISRNEAKRLLGLEGVTCSPSCLLMGVVSQHIRGDAKLNKAVQLFFQEFLKQVLIKHPDLQILFLPFSSHKDDSYDRDILCGLWLKESLKSERFKVLRNVYSPEQMVGLFSHFNVIISTRFHPLVFATKMKVPAIGIKVFGKVESYCKANNLPLVELNEIERLHSIFESTIR